MPELDFVVAPVGGGGLLVGTAITTAAISPRTKVIGAEPAAVDDAARSLRTGQHQPRVDDPTTACDGLLTRLGAPNFAALMALHVEVLTAREASILAAARTFLERMKIVVEPSGAVPLAVLDDHRERFVGKRIGTILSGGNTDFAWLSR